MRIEHEYTNRGVDFTRRFRNEKTGCAGPNAMKKSSVFYWQGQFKKRRDVIQQRKSDANVYLHSLKELRESVQRKKRHLA